MRLVRLSGLAVVILGLGLAAAGCSSSAASSQPQSGPSSSDNTVIKLGLISTIQSQAFSFKDSAQAFQAAVDSLNAAGGIKGHKLEAFVCDDQAQASVAAQCANKLINQDQVVAIGGGISPVDGPVYTAAKAANIGVFCYNGATPAAAQIPTFFACQSVTYAYINMATLFQPGWKSVSLVNYQGLPSTAPWIKQGMTTAGSSVKLQDIPAALTTVDWGPIVAQAKAQHADGIISQLAASADLALMQAEVSAGVKIPVLTTSGQFQTPEAQFAAAHGIPAYIASAYINDPSQSKLRAQELADLKKYAPGIDDTISDTTAAAWLFPYLLKVGADSYGLTDFSRQGIVNWASAQTDLKTGFLAPLDWKNPGPIPAVPRYVNFWAAPSTVDSSGNVVLIRPEFENLSGQKAATLPIT